MSCSFHSLLDFCPFVFVSLLVVFAFLLDALPLLSCITTFAAALLAEITQCSSIVLWHLLIPVLKLGGKGVITSNCCNRVIWNSSLLLLFWESVYLASPPNPHLARSFRALHYNALVKWASESKRILLWKFKSFYRSLHYNGWSMSYL